MLRHHISAAIALFYFCIAVPNHAEVQQDLAALRALVQFLEIMVTNEGCDLAEVLRGCSKLKNFAIHAVERVQGVRRPESSDGDAKLKVNWISWQ